MESEVMVSGARHSVARAVRKPIVVLIVVAGLGRGLIAQGSAPAQPPQAPPTVEESVVVVGVTPIQGLGIDRNLIPANIQTVTIDTLARTAAVSAADQLQRAAASVHVNEATTNPLQPDLQFRGFTASPLLGLPQGLAVYQNGVRLNEPFGDTVNWDLLPGNAIADVSLMPGSNPLFGLNALGGAVSVQTKTGFSHPGHALTVSGGSFGRSVVEGVSGGGTERVSYFVAGTALSEDGWRDFSPSRVRQLFGDVTYRTAATSVNATLTLGHNRLIGNGAVPIELLAEDRSAIFTHPDETTTRMALFTLGARHTPNASTSLDGTLFFRRASIGAFNGDDSDYDECDNGPFAEFLCSDEGEGEPVRDPFGGFIPVDEDDELNGTNNTSETLSHGWGGALQATIVAPLADRPNHFVTGVTFDGGRSRYEADTEIARLTDDRGTIGTGFYDRDAMVRLRTSVRHTGLYAADFVTVVPRLTLMGAARFNYSTVRLRDQIGTDLDGDHRFARLNPAVGLTYELTGGQTVYGSFSMSSRVPAPSELSCSDPEDPCRLPNAFVADPPLAQVVAGTWEAGVRGRGRGVTWNASFFRTENRDDIMFVSSGPLTNTGHFENVGDTRRRGLELSASGAARAVRWAAAYSLLRAAFATPLTLSSPNHPEEEDGEVGVAPGSRIPGVPQHNIKASLTATFSRLTLGGSLTATSHQYLRGDEANLLPAIDGFGLVQLTADYAIGSHVRLTGRVSNLFDRQHATFGLLGEADEVLGDDYEDARFLSPGAPRAAWVALEFSFR
jgi:outer membrane receptor protein involved in Fe transport